MSLKLAEHCRFCGHAMAWHKWGRTACQHAEIGLKRDCFCECGCSQERAERVMALLGKDPVKDIAEEVGVTQRQVKAVIAYEGYRWNRAKNVWERPA